MCAIKRLLKGELDEVEDVVAIAGSLENVGGAAFEYEATRLKTSDSTSDSKKEGVRLVLKGGKHPLSGPVKERHEQKAIVEFLCDPDKTGLEGEWTSEDRYEEPSANKLRRRDDGDEKKEEDGEEDDGSESGLEHQLKEEDSALIWDSYGKDDKGADVLRLTWHTKYACEEKRDDDNDDSGDSNTSSGWGFFTWFIIM